MENEQKSKLPKPPTRLQKQAPPSLHLDQLSSVSVSENTSSKAILPLLSPLPSSPQHLPGNAVNGGGGSGGDLRGIGFAGSGGWKHPAMETTFADPSNQFTLFRSQCIVSSNTP